MANVSRTGLPTRAGSGSTFGHMSQEDGGNEVAGDGVGSSDGGTTEIHDLVRAELLAARRSPEGLSANSMTNFPAMRDLLGDGDPLVAFKRLTHRLLETLDTKDDVRAIEAAAYSLGLASGETTHLARLEEFGTEYGYEVRQVRRYSDKGIEQLAQLITSNWVVHTVPTLEVFLAQQSNGSLAVTLRTTRQHFIDMQAVEAYEQQGDEPRTARPTVLRAETAEGQSANGLSGSTRSTSPRIVESMDRPFVLKPAEPGTPRHLRFVWQGEIWPRFALSIVGALSGEQIVTSQTLGNTMQVSIEALKESDES